jgi:hypothetical protein
MDQKERAAETARQAAEDKAREQIKVAPVAQGQPQAAPAVSAAPAAPPATGKPELF